MLTVKVCRQDGSESVFEATRLDKEPGGLLIQRDGGTVFCGIGGHFYDLSSDTRSKLPDPMAQQSAASVFVMNRHGATVATYRV